MPTPQHRLPRSAQLRRRLATGLPLVCLVVFATGCGRRGEAPAEEDPAPARAIVTPRPPVTPPVPDPVLDEPELAPPPREKLSPIRFRSEMGPALNGQVPATYALENPPAQRVGLKDGRRLPLETAGGIVTVCLLRDGTVLLGTNAGELLQWDLATDRRVATFNHKASEVHAIVATPDEATAVIVSRSAGWNLAGIDIAGRGQLWREFDRAQFGRPSVSFDGTRVYLMVNGLGKVFDARTGRELHRTPKGFAPFRVWRAYPDNVHVLMSLEHDPRFPVVLAVSDPAQPNKTNPALARYDDKQESWVTHACEFSPDGRLLAWGGVNAILVLDAETGALRHKLKLASPPGEVSFSRDRRLLGWRDTDLSVSGLNGVAHVFDLAAGKEVLRVEIPTSELNTYLTTVSFAADNTLLLGLGRTLVAYPPLRP